mgnify:CR=1 FL=1
MKFIKQETTAPGLRHIDWGLFYIGKTPARVILGPCLSIIISSAKAKTIGLSHIYPTPFDDNKYGPYNHPENVVDAFSRYIRQHQLDDAELWVIDREKTTIRGKELIMRSIDAIAQLNYIPTVVNGFPQRCALTSNPEQMQVEIYDISSHEDFQQNNR